MSKNPDQQHLPR